MSKSRTPAAPNTSASFVEAMEFVANNRSAEPTPAPEPEIIDTPVPAAAPAPAPVAVAEPAPAIVPAPAPTAIVESTPPAAPSAQPAADSQATKGKRDAAPTESFDYAGAFLRPVRTRKTKAIYVDEALHQALSVLTQVAGVDLADLLINIANDHFETYRPAIQKYMSDQEKLRKKQLPY